jgi:Bacteriophage tail sheath protein
MATTYKTPGVYIREPDSFPPSIVAVETAVPAFIGYTERATDTNGRSLALVPTRVESMAEFAAMFGGMYREQYYLEPTPTEEQRTAAREAAETAETAAAATWASDHPDATDEEKTKAAADRAAAAEAAETSGRVGDIELGGKRYLLRESGGGTFNLYNSLRLFYANGGGSCYIVSCGDYGGTVAGPALVGGVAAVANVIGPTMLAVPDAVLLDFDAYVGVCNAILTQCMEQGDRIALLDVHGTDNIDPASKVLSGAIDTVVGAFRASVGPVRESWRYGAAYFPFMQTSVVQPTEISLANFDLNEPNRGTLIEALQAEVNLLMPRAEGEEAPQVAETAAPVTGGGSAGDKDPGSASEGGGGGGATSTATISPVSTRAARSFTLLAGIEVPAASGALTPGERAAELKTQTELRQLSQTLVASIPALAQLFKQMAAAQNLLPPSGAIAGIYAMNDSVRGVWNAPANVGVNGLVAPNIAITERDQEDLNVPLEGKAINAIRTFPGRGSLVWGARTLDSNSNDWRYVQVRRTMIFIEQSVKTALNSFVFAPNTAQTWVTVVSMIESFLHGVWSAGGLMGASPGEAYNVQAGLGSTMTPIDVLEGRMLVQITLQMIHPAEFIELTFRQQMLGGV